MKTNHKYFVGLLVLLMPLGISAETFEDKFFSSVGPQQGLIAEEQEMIEIARKWQKGQAQGVKPILARDGSVRFLFGSGQPRIVCAVLQICDIALQPGERVNSIHLGDSVRWSVEPAVTGSGAQTIQHLIVKPLDVGLETSLVVTTNRRTYHLNLRSHRSDYMPKVSFSYPEEAIAKWQQIQAEEEKERTDRTIPETGEYLGNLDFNYWVGGKARWKPLRVFNDGQKTIIQMPHTMAQTEAPSLLVIRKGRGLFSKDETVMVNYRLQGDRYIVDSVFDEAVLIAGVGRNQDSVRIRRRVA